MRTEIFQESKLGQYLPGEDSDKTVRVTSEIGHETSPPNSVVAICGNGSFLITSSAL